jgi:hypothetical protein
MSFIESPKPTCHTCTNYGYPKCPYYPEEPPVEWCDSHTAGEVPPACGDDCKGECSGEVTGTPHCPYPPAGPLLVEKLPHPVFHEGDLVIGNLIYNEKDQHDLLETFRRQRPILWNHVVQHKPATIQDITIGMVYSFEDGMSDGMKKGREKTLKDLLLKFLEADKQGESRPWNMGHIESVILGYAEEESKRGKKK